MFPEKEVELSNEDIFQTLEFNQKNEVIHYIKRKNPKMHKMLKDTLNKISERIFINSFYGMALESQLLYTDTDLFDLLDKEEI